MADENLTININTKANTVGVDKVKLNFAQLREMGEKISNIGVRLSAVFTAPVIGIVALISKNEELQKSLKPIHDAFGKIINDLAIGLIPVIKDLTPAILSIAKTVQNLVDKFNALSVGQKENILKFVLFAAAIGPVLAIVGQVLGFIGTVGVVFQTLGAGLSAAVPGVTGFGAAITASFGPIIPLLVAVAGLIALINSEFGQSGITAGKQLLAGAWGGLGTIVTGDKARGEAAFLSASKTFGLIGPQASTVPAGAGPTVFNYQPFISTADQMAATQALTPIIQNALRTQPGRAR